MINVLTAEQVRAAERVCGVEERFLRLNASLAAADLLTARAKARGAVTAVFCGPGGNGADGMLVAARLKRCGAKDITVYTVYGERADSALVDYVKHEGVDVLPFAEYKGGATLVVDAVFGIGLRREVDGEVAALFDRLNSEEAAFRVALDVPSGLDCDTGNVMGVAVRADVTITFSCYKHGMLFGSGRDMCGKMVVCDVGIPTKSDIVVIEDGDMTPFKRKKTAHKGDAGRVYVIGGCGTMVGAPMMAAAAAHAAYLNGAGTVTVCVPSVQRAALASRMTMAMMKFLSDDKNGYVRFNGSELDEIMQKATAINIGPGMGAAPELKDIIEYLCKSFTGSLVIDADGLNALAGNIDIIKNARCSVVLTPHAGEFTRLTGRPATPQNAAELATETGAVVVLKSATTVITDGKQLRVNITGTPAMAKGGTGDVLGGCIASLCCAYSPFDAATVACYRNGMGAERAVSSFAELMLTPKQMLSYADYDE